MPTHTHTHILTTFVYLPPVGGFPQQGKTMDRKRLLKLQLRSLYLHSIDKLRDLATMVVPIFIVSGILTACFRFWIWILFAW